MIELITKINEKEVSNWIDMLKELPLKDDVSTYAPGRKRIWVNGLGEPSLTYEPRLLESHKSEKIHSAIEKLGIKYDFCLVHYSGEAAKGIKLHRDASYAMPTAYGINLGSCNFTHNGKTYHLTGGEIYSFDCKLPHGAKPAKHRWGINLWTVKQDWLKKAKDNQRQYYIVRKAV